MKLIRNLVCTEIENGFLLFNTLNGLIDAVDQKTVAILGKWIKQDSIEPETQEEQKLYETLGARGYLCVSHEEEQRKKDNLIAKLRALYERDKYKIKALTFAMTYNCNFRCPYCFESIADDLKGCYISKEQIDAGLAMAGDDLEHIGLFGGEPLLPKNREAIAYLIEKAPDKEYDVITNGYYLDQYIDLLSKVKVSYVMVTLDGKKSVHDKRRFLANGAPTYDKIMENIALCLRNQIPVRIRMNVDADTLGEIEELQAHLTGVFADYASLLSFEISPMMEIKPDERNNLFGKLEEIDAQQASPEQKNVFLTRGSPIVNCVLNGGRLTPTYSYCAGHEQGYIVDPLGLIYTCLVAVGKPRFAVGAYYPEVRFFEQSIKNRNIETIEKCRSCAYSLLCGGGCPLKIQEDQSIYQPECGTVLNDIHGLLPSLLRARRGSENCGERAGASL